MGAWFAGVAEMGQHQADCPGCRMLNTEAPSDAHPDLDLYDLDALVAAFVDDQAQALAAVRAARGAIAAAVAAAVERIAQGGRLIYVGAGTSGRLGVLDSTELYPTFSWPRDRALALIAGGERAVFESIEGAEDRRDDGERDLQAIDPSPLDVVILLAASGTTPYVMGALAAARAAGALTIGIANNPGAPVTQGAHHGITLNTGSEIISGSTRLKAGTAQKIALNTLSSSIMVRLNKVYGNLMVDVQPTNAKLRQRAVQLTMRATGATDPQARRALHECDDSVKLAIVALLLGVGAEQARERLAVGRGSVRAALASHGAAAAGLRGAAPPGQAIPTVDGAGGRWARPAVPGAMGAHPTLHKEIDMREEKPVAKGDPKRDMDRELDRQSNRDPLSGAAGAHPVGVGIGATAGGIAAGAAAGSVAGPVGTAVGAIVGAVAGGLVGKGVAEMVDPTVEDAYWRDNYATRSYVRDDASYDDYGPAYRYGVERFRQTDGRQDFDALETDMGRGWDDARGQSRLMWDDAKLATRDAWDRARNNIERAMPGDSDGDGL